MLNNQTLAKLAQLKLSGMAQAFQEQLNMPDMNGLPFEERFGFLTDREILVRENRKLSNRLKMAKLRQNAVLEDIDFKSERGIDKSVILTLANCQWVTRHQNIVITGPTGVGKSYLACALAHKACREGFSSSYQRFPRLLQELSIGRGDGQYLKILDKLSKINILIIDDWGLSVMSEFDRKDLMELFDDRYGNSSTIITSQIPISKWHEVIGDPTLADGILDRLLHNAHKINMKGGSMRKKQGI
jgi:DNA replication protein DnaC